MTTITPLVIDNNDAQSIPSNSTTISMVKGEKKPSNAH
jgi:hypothetical protein